MTEMHGASEQQFAFPSDALREVGVDELVVFRTNGACLRAPRTTWSEVPSANEHGEAPGWRRRRPPARYDGQRSECPARRQPRRR